MINRLRSMDRRLFTILMIVFVQMLGASMVNPILPLYAQSEFNLQPQVITLLLTAFFAAQFIAGPFIGRLSDQRGRIPVLIISQIGTVIAFLMIALAQSAELLFIARVLDGITGGNIIVAQAYITDIMPEEQRTQALGYIFAAFGLGFIFGPALGGALAGAFGAQIPFLLAAVAALLTVILTWFTLEETLSTEDRLQNRKFKSTSLNPMMMLRNVPLVAVLIISFVAQFGFGLFIAVFALYSEAVLLVGYDPSSIQLGVGLILGVVGLGQFITQLVILPRVIARYNDPMIVMLGAVARGISMFIFAVALNPLLGGVGAALFALGSGLMMPPLQSLATKTVGPENRGGILGVYQSVINLAVIISTAAGGILFEIQPTIPFWVAGILFWISLVPGLFLWNWARKRNKAKVEQLAVQP